MPTNNFLEIATGGGANVQTQVDYAADPDRTGFFADGGVPDADQHGKMFRQPSVIAHMVAQAICDLTGADMLDDGNAATQLANFKKLLGISSSLNYIAAAGTVNAITIAPGGPAAYKQGETWFIVPSGVSTITGVTLNRDGIGAKAVVHPDGSVLAVGDIPAVGIAQVVYQAGLDKFILLTTYASLLNAMNALITASVALPGWIKFPTGIMLQWTTFSIAPTNTNNTPPNTKWGGPQSVSWPVAFPHAIFSAQVINQITTNGQFKLQVIQPSTSFCDVYSTCWDDVLVGLPMTGYLFGVGW